METEFVFVHEIEEGVGLQPFQKLCFAFPEPLLDCVFQGVVVAVDL